VDFRALRHLGAAGAWSTATVDLRVRAPELDLAAWRGVHPVLERLGGTVDLALALGGPAAAPDGSLTLRAAHLAVGEEDLGPVDARGRLDGGQLVLDELRFSLGGSPLAVRGSTPVRLRLTGLPALARDEPLDLRIELVQASLGAARYITDRVADAEGPVNGAIELSGSLAAPVFRGAADVAGGRLRVRGREETLEDVAGHIEFAGDRIRFTGVTATDGADGRLSAEGTIELRGLKVAGYEAVVKLERFQVESSGDYQAVLDGSFTLVRRGAGGLPEYTGSVVVRRLDYLREVVGRGAPAEPGPSSWVGHFDLDLPRNAWIRNMDLEVELKGQLTYEREVSGIVLLGRLETVRGRYDLFGHTFRITSGEIQFNDPVEIDPELNVTGETRIPEARIFATITGRASDRQVTLTSDPDYDQATLWKMLVPSGRGEVTSLVAMTPLVRELERSLSREIPGLSVSIESQTSETGDQPILGARVGKTIGSDVFVSAYQGFSSTSQQDVSVEYGLGTLFFLKGSAVRRGVTEGTSQDIEQEYNIDLNLRFEF
jgi:translocation and assembly module TamB